MLIPSPAPVPVTNPTTSYWQSFGSRLEKFRTTPSLPKQVDFIVIGGGISGSSLAYQLLKKKPGVSVLLLEARDACSGASGRNVSFGRRLEIIKYFKSIVFSVTTFPSEFDGPDDQLGGHCRPGRYVTFNRDTQLHGIDEAIAIARFEETNVRQLASFVQEHNINCALESVTTVDLYETGTEALLNTALDAIGSRKLALANEISSGKADERTIHTASEAKDKFQTPNAIGAISFPAYTINPYQFVCRILELSLAAGLNLQTGTPVQSISSHNAVWTVKTSRGSTTAPNIILATNAYTSHLLPSAARFIKPIRNQALAMRSGRQISSTPFLKTHSLCFNYTSPAHPGMYGDDYMVTKPHHQHHPSSTASAPVVRPRDVILGGARHLAPGYEEYITDDSSIDPEISAHLNTVLQNQHFGRKNWGVPGDTICEWTGIVGYTPDGNPVLGGVPGQAGLWICAGFTGHGMAMAFRSADAVSSFAIGRGSEVEGWVPRSFLWRF